MISGRCLSFALTRMTVTDTGQRATVVIGARPLQLKLSCSAELHTCCFGTAPSDSLGVEPRTPLTELIRAHTPSFDQRCGAQFSLGNFTTLLCFCDRLSCVASVLKLFSCKKKKEKPTIVFQTARKHRGNGPAFSRLASVKTKGFSSR
jgi:hypothetical protein